MIDMRAYIYIHTVHTQLVSLTHGMCIRHVGNRHFGNLSSCVRLTQHARLCSQLNLHCTLGTAKARPLACTNVTTTHGTGGGQGSRAVSSSKNCSYARCQRGDSVGTLVATIQHRAVEISQWLVSNQAKFRELALPFSCNWMDVHPMP